MSIALAPGANTALTAPQLSVEVAAPKALDVSALLLGADGKVRSDADLVFYNVPEGPGVRFTDGRIEIQPALVPADVERVVITASLDDPRAVFGGTEPTATVRDTANGEVLATFTPPQLTAETALIVVELYRRGGGWKLRAVGQGYADGLAGIATDFGVEIEEPSAAQAAPPQSAPAQPASTPAPAAPAQAPAPTPTPTPAPAPADNRITLDKGRVSLTKGGSVSLVKNGRPFLASVRMGLGWEPAHRRRDVDLDASVIAFDARGKDLDKVWFSNLQAFNGAIQHAGDNLTGAGSGDDEVITVHLEALPTSVHALVFTVNSFSGQKFTDVAKAYCRLLDAASGAELVRFDLTRAEPRTGVLMCKLVRAASGEWVMTALGEYEDSRTVKGMVKPAAARL